MIRRYYYWVLAMCCHTVLYSQDYQFRVAHADFDDQEQVVQLALETNNFEALNFFNQSQEDFTVKIVDPRTRIPMECDVVDLKSDQLSKNGLKEWHIIIDAKGLVNADDYDNVRRVYRGIKKANLAQNTFVNVYLLGTKMMKVSSDFVRLPKFEEVAELSQAVDYSKTNYLEISNIFNADRRHIIALITDGSIGDQVRSQDQERVQSLLLEKIQEYKEEVEIYPILYRKESSTAFMTEIAEATSSANDEVEVNGIRKIARQKDGTFSRRSLFDFTIIARPQLLKDQHYTLANDPVHIICQYDNQKTDRTYSVQSKTVGATAARPVVYYGINAGSAGWLKVLLGLGLLAFVMLSLYLVIPVYNRYVFKKNHVFKYQDIKQAKRTRKDPLTLEEFQCDNDIVVFGEKMMLLDTWKYMRDRDDIETAKDYSEFFQDNIEGNIFSHNSGQFYWSYLAFFAATAALLVYGAYQSALLLIDHISLQQALASSGLDILGDGLMTWVIFVSATLVGLAVYYFQNKLSDLSYWRGLWLAVPILIGCVAAPLLVQLGESLDTSTLSSHWRDLLWGLCMAATVAITMRKFDRQSFVSHVLSILTGTLLYYLLLRLGGISGLAAALGPSLMLAITLLIGYVTQNLLLALGAVEQKVKLLKIISPDGYSGTLLPLDTKIRKKWSIGNNPKNDIYIKWLDYDVRNDHCYIEYGKGIWTAYAYNGEIFKNGVVVSNGTELIVGDVLSLGPNGITQFKFDEVSANEVSESGYQNTNSGKPESTGSKPLVVESEAKEQVPVKNRIIIRPRTS